MSASSHFQYLLGGSQQTKVASDRLDLLAKTAARRYLHESIPLNVSIKKIAAENDLNPNQIERVCEIANLATHQGLWAKTAQKESVAFDLADAKTIIRVSGSGTNGAPCDVAPPPPVCGGDSDYMGPPKGIPSAGPSMMSMLGSDPSQVHNGMGAEPEHKADGLQLDGGRTRGEPGGVAPRIGMPGRGGGDRERAGQLGVHQQRPPEPRQHRHRLAQVARADLREIIHARRDEEALEAEHAGGG